MPVLAKRSAQILQLLSNEGELHALGMTRKRPTLRRGSVYTILQRMHEAGFVTSREADPEPEPGGYRGIPKRLWSITERGRRMLVADAAAKAVLKKRKIAEAVSPLVEELAIAAVSEVRRIPASEVAELAQCDAKIGDDVAGLVAGFRAVIRQWVERS